MLTLFLAFVIAFGSSERSFCQTDLNQVPSPLIKKGQPTDWWFAFKFNAETFPRNDGSIPSCMFGGQAGGVRKYTLIGQDYVYASKDHPALEKGDGFLGDSTDDPLGATFDEVYNGNLFYVVWNDQFYRDPLLKCEGTSAKSNQCGARWGHSKGLLVWDANGNGFVLQVTTPSWPASGSAQHPRKTDGNSLGCVNDDDVDLSQDFFSVKLNTNDVVTVLAALKEEGAVTDLNNLQIVRTGGPQQVKDAVSALGAPNKDATFTDGTLSSGVRIIAKAGGLGAPPWQVVSSVLDGAPLRVANFWQGTLIHSTLGGTTPTCWPEALAALKAPGAVEIAKTGKWDGTTIGLTGTSQKLSGANIGANHAKIAVTTNQGSGLTIFGDMNEDGVLSASATACFASQNARGGTFFVIDNVALHDSVAALLKGETDPPVDQPPAATPTTTQMVRH
jgi:hypothetical protein